MWTPKLVTVFKEEEARTTVEIYRLIYIFKKRFIYMIIIVKEKGQQSKLAAMLLEDGAPNGHQLTQ